MTQFEKNLREIAAQPRRWLVTGVAGFIGSHLAEQLLLSNQEVVGLDNFVTGRRSNLEDVRKKVGEAAWSRFLLIEGDIRDPASCREACTGVQYVLHQAALGSVPRSINDPLATHETNLTGFLNILIAAQAEGVSRFVYAASSSTYGDSMQLPKVEPNIGNPLSPYAVTKLANELYARVFATVHNFQTVGLRYFNVFGPRQDPEGAYAAVIPRWIKGLLERTPCVIHGDGETSRDFTYVENVVQANLLAALASSPPMPGEVFNVALGERTTLNELFSLIRDAVASWDPQVAVLEPDYSEFRSGDVRHSQADISRIQARLGYQPLRSIEDGMVLTVESYCEKRGTVATG